MHGSADKNVCGSFKGHELLPSTMLGISLPSHMWLQIQRLWHPLLASLVTCAEEQHLHTDPKQTHNIPNWVNPKFYLPSLCCTKFSGWHLYTLQALLWVSVVWKLQKSKVVVTPAYVVGSCLLGISLRRSASVNEKPSCLLQNSKWNLFQFLQGLSKRKRE